MNHPLHLPALDGRDPLGFLATLGLLRLLTEEIGADVKLSFSDTTAQAILHGPYSTCDQVAEALSTLITKMPEGAVIPGLPANYPPARAGTKGSDPMRAPCANYPHLVTQTHQAGGHKATTWLAAIVTDLGQDDKGRVALTRYCAPSGQQTVRSYFEKPLSMIRAKPAHLAEALARWRRVPGVTGEYLDHRVLRSAADHPLGESSEIGVPGATWLATMALPLFRLTGDGTAATATLWRHPAGQPPTMLWPVWRQPLRLPAVVALIEHPAITATIHRNHVAAHPDHWPALGVFALAAAQRQPIEGRKNSGVLAPIPVTIPEPRR